MVIPVNMANVEAMGSQFKENVFNKIAPKAFKVAAKHKYTPPPVNRQAPIGTTATAGTPTRNAPGNTLPAGSAAPTGGSGLPGGAVPRGLPVGQTRAPQGGFATPHTPGATPHSNTGPNRLAIGSGRQPIATPYNAPPRVIPMGGGTPATHMPFSHPTTQQAVNRTHFNQPSTTPFTPIAPTAQAASTGTPTMGHNIPTATPATHMGANHPYPTHEHPAGSSTDILPNLSAAQSTPGRPNQFTVGSRNIRGGGIAAMGSQLEAGLMRRPIGLPEPKRRV